MPKHICRFTKNGVFLALILSFSMLFSSCVIQNEENINAASKITFREASAIASSPEVSAKAAIGIELSSGEIFFAKNIDKRLPMASTTKIMTALVALENGDITDKVKVDKAATGIEGSSIYLYEGEILTLENLLYATLLESANDAATAVAIHIGGTVEDFVDMMNDKAKALGLTNTHFDNPHGLDSETHYTTARELGIISAYAMKNPTFREMVSTYKTTIPMQNGGGTRVLINHNKLLRNYDGAIGVKTGYTKKSGRCLVSASSKDGVELICVTISAPSDWQDHESILDFGNSLYESKTLAYKNEFSCNISVVGGQKNTVTAQIPYDVVATVRKGRDIDIVIEAQRFLYAPIYRDQTVGKVIFIQDGHVIAEAPLIATETIYRHNNKKIFSK